MDTAFWQCMKADVTAVSNATLFSLCAKEGFMLPAHLPNGLTPLQHAVAFTWFPEWAPQGDAVLARIRFFLEKEEDVDRRSLHGDTALSLLLHDIRSRFAWRLDTLQSIFLLLLEQGADKTVRTQGGATLLYALFKGPVFVRNEERETMALFLLRHGVPCTGYTIDGHPMLPLPLLTMLVQKDFTEPQDKQSWFTTARWEVTFQSNCKGCEKG